MSKVPRKKQNGYGLFILAAAIYTAGVIAFSIWSFFLQRSNLLEQVDQSLINATHATEQILGSVFIECAVEAETVYKLGYAANQQHLDRFAGDCQFERLGAIGLKKGTTWKLIAGSKYDRTVFGDPSLFLNLSGSILSSSIQKLARSENETVWIQTMTTGENEERRIAVRYHSLGTEKGYALLVARSTHDVKQLIHALAIRTAAIALFLHVMACPLILLYSRTQKKAAQKAAGLNIRLQQDFAKQKEREAELEDAIHDLERFNNVTVGREGRIIELKAEVNTLLKQMERPNRYSTDHIE